MARVVSSDGGGRPVGHLTPWQEESRQGLMQREFSPTRRIHVYPCMVYMLTFGVYRW
jgi:hypothetical protein